jgi:hypothetical protein
MSILREPDARDHRAIESLIENASSDAAWGHAWSVAPPALSDFGEVPDFGDFFGAGKRLGNKRLQRWQAVKKPLANALDDVGQPEAASAMRGCGCIMIRDRYQRGSVFRAMNECNHLVCPTGQMRRAARLTEAKGLERFIKKHPGSKPVFLTLTTQDVASYDLWVAVNQILAAYAKLMRRAPVKRAFSAWLRSLEVTRNPQTGRWMAHLHCIAIVDKHYKRGSKHFIDFELLRALWKACLRATYDPIVRIQKLEGCFAPLDVRARKSLKECIKYCFKPSSLIIAMAGGKPAIIGTKTPELFDANDGKGLRWMTNVPLRALIQALKDRRLVQTSANLKVEQELDFTDDPDADAKAAVAELGDFICREIYAWRDFQGRGDFFLVSRSFEQPKSSAGFAMGP